ncbi:aldo/keto reductase [Puniceicoccales bacterium CK1056]|uniref:Aldo/keto reductase n=1 Tax=Oceanipulchritudo coccoides TaxID=2706888 RepID=A0A6B2M3W2_9BACT|nr:aldo/keto reductase [Oceanipulchritudo coccoides]NDV62777.1 aldo/keto reductase [Oceanipulchritudo coccoides]
MALGCWALGGKGWGGQSEKDSLEVMEEAYRRGIRHFDTAQGYGCSEKLVGKFIGNERGKFFLASKVYPGQEPGCIREALHRSLENLCTDRIDLYYLHWPREGMDIRKQVEELAEAREEGLIGSIGVSNYSVEQIQLAMEVAPIDFLQAGHHLFWRYIEKDILPFCRDNGIRVVSYSSLGQGILTGKFGRQLRFPAGDHRTRVIHFQEEVWPRVYEAVEALRPLAKQAGRPMAHLALQWSASREGVSCILAGARNRRQMAENSAAFEGAIDPAILQEMTRISDGLIPELPEATNIFNH